MKTDPTSVVDYLKSTGKDSSFASRTSLAKEYGISDYVGSGEQNIKLLNFLKTGNNTPTSPNQVANLDQANNFINQNQATDFENASKGDEVPIRSSISNYANLTKEISNSIFGGEKRAEAPSMLESFTKYREQYGVDELETGLSELQKQAQLIQDRNRARRLAEEEKGVPMNVIEGRKGEIDKQDQLALDTINREIKYTSDLINTKLNIVNNLMNFKKLDYEFAKNDYDTTFNQSISLMNVAKGIKEEEKSEEEKKTDNARANLQIMYNAVLGGGADFSSIDPEQKTLITKLEMQAGLPVGFYQTLQNKNIKGDILSTTTREAGGVKYADIITRNQDGSMSVKSIKVGASSSGSGGGNLSSSEQLSEARKIVGPQLQSQRGPDNFVTIEAYNKGKDAWINAGFGADDYDKSFKSYLNRSNQAKLGL